MKWNRFALSVFFFLFAVSFPSFAQEEAVPEKKLSTASSAMQSKVCFVRIWYAGGPKSPRLTFCLKSGEKEPDVIGSYVRPGRLVSYRMFLPGKYSLLILDGSVIPDAHGRIAPGATPIVPSEQVDLKPGSFHTIVVQDTDGRFSLSLMEDKPPVENSGPILRVYDYTHSQNEFLSLHSADREMEIWNSGQGSPFSKEMPGVAGESRIELSSINSGNPRILNAFETEIDPKHAYSIAIFYDRYGDRAFSFFKDADVDVNEDQIRSFLESAAH